MKVERLQMKLSVTSLTMALLVAIVYASLTSSATENSETVEKKSRRIESNALRTPLATTTPIISNNENNESIEPSPADTAASAVTTTNRRGSASSRKSATPHHLNSSSSSMLLQRHLPPGARSSSRQNVIHGSDSAVVIARMTYLKKEMCKSEPLEQVIKEPGCIRRRIVNRFCYGQCNSFFIPRVVVQSDRRRKDRPQSGGGGGRRNRQGRRRLPKSEEDEEASIASSSFRSCSFCRPKTIEWDVVILQCPNSKPPIRRKRIPVVKQCACVALSFDRS